MTYLAIQHNGERIRIEGWAFDAWRAGTLRDPFIARYLYGAVHIHESDWLLPQNVRELEGT